MPSARPRPNNTIIASGAHWSGLTDLLALEPLADPNVIYTFHDYEPFPFTHQGATWTSPEVRPERAIPYPSTPEDIAPKLDEEPTWPASSSSMNTAKAAGTPPASRTPSSSLRSGPPSTTSRSTAASSASCAYYAPPADRAQWLHDMRVALEKEHIGWAMWDYQTDFGVVTKANGVTTPDADIVNALGLNEK